MKTKDKPPRNKAGRTTRLWAIQQAKNAICEAEKLGEPEFTMPMPVGKELPKKLPVSSTKTFLEILELEELQDE